MYEGLNAKPGVLRSLLAADDLAVFLEAHSPLAARIVESEGGSAIWASGFSIATCMGVRDANELTFSEVLAVVEPMAEQTTIPILVDGDTGWGNFNNLRRAVTKLERAGVAGICVEDKLFPKQNSFIGERQTLADVGEFCGKISAAVDSRCDDFVVVARIEALVSGWPLEEALRRADAYVDAGADAILIHSKKKTADEVVEFCRMFDGKRPVLIVPTTYASTPLSVYSEAGVNGLIWANQMLRSSISAMQAACRSIRTSGGIQELESAMVNMEDVFHLLDYSELERAERDYLPRD